MINRRVFDEAIEKIGAVCSNRDSTGFEDVVDKINAQKDAFRVKLMLIGHFSAGKSSLLNSFLKRPELLKEAQGPQTAIATELRYSKNEEIVAFDNNGNAEEYVEGKDYSPNDYTHISYKLNSVELAQLSDYTIVDTPGFDSSIENHTKALQRYIGNGEGTAYLVVVDQEKGGIDQTSLDFILEISSYTRQVAVLINKCDKISAETAQEIVSGAKETLEAYGLPYEVYSISKLDEDITEKMLGIISGLNSQEVFEKVMKKAISNSLSDIRSNLFFCKNSLTLDTSEVDRKIAELEMVKKRSTEQFSNAVRQLKNENSDKVESIISNVEMALANKAGSIAGVMTSGNEAAVQAIIVETIRPVIISSMKDLQNEQLDSIAGAIDFSGVFSDNSESEEITKIAVNIAENLKNYFDTSCLDIDDIDDSDLDEAQKAYKSIVGVLAIATDVVSPWIEIVLLVLPDVIRILGKLFGESNKTDSVKNKFINVVIPQISSRLREQVVTSVDNSTDLIAMEYQRELEEKLDDIKNSISELEDKKHEESDKLDSLKESIDNDINTVEELLKKYGGNK